MDPVQKLTPELARDILKKYGKEVLLEIASEIVDFMNLFAEITIKNYLDNWLKKDDLNGS